MDNVYILSDYEIRKRIGARLKTTRLKQNITQQSLSGASCVPVSTLKRIENGQIGSFDNFLRIIRTLGLLDILTPLVEEEQMSPTEYWDFVNKSRGRQRKRAVGTIKTPAWDGPEWQTTENQE